jgi:hypothetical protein
MTRSMFSGVLPMIPARHNLAAPGIGVVAYQPGLAIPNCPHYVQSLRKALELGLVFVELSSPNKTKFKKNKHRQEE